MKPVFKRNRMSQQVADHLLGLIRQSFKPGDKLDSERTFSEQLGVSLPTVREALGILAEQELIERRHGSGTYVLDPDANRHVAVLMELDIGHPRTSFFYTRLVQSVRLLLEEKGFKVRLYIGHTAPGAEFEGLTCRDFMEDVQANRISGVVALALPNFIPWDQPLVERGIPVVGGNNYGPIFDYKSGIRTGVQRLAEAGRKRLALIGSGGPGATNVFRESLAQYGLQFEAHWVPETGGQPAAPGLGWRLFRDVWSAQAVKPDGLLVLDDMIFRDAAMAMLEADVRVPADLLVITESNRGSFSHYPFPVIQLEYDPDAFARVYVDLLGALLRKDPVKDPHVTIPFRVVEPEALVGAEGIKAKRGNYEDAN